MDKWTNRHAYSRALPELAIIYVTDWKRQRSLTHLIEKTETGHRGELTVSIFITIYVTHCLVYCRRVYRRADCKCDNAHSLGLCWNHFARHRGFCDRRVDCTTFLKAPAGSRFHPAGFLMSIIGAIVLVLIAKLLS
jgi:hypothetical protein